MTPQIKRVGFSGKTGFSHQDHLGSNRAVIYPYFGVSNQGGDYGPFGAPMGTPINGRAYINERYDAEDGLQYLHARYFDPKLGRFLTPDTWNPELPGVDINRYAYAGNDPINGSDKEGHVMEWLVPKEDWIKASETAIDDAEYFADRGDMERADMQLDIAERAQEFADSSPTDFAVNEGLSLLGNLSAGSGKQLANAGKTLLGKLGSPLRGGIGYRSFDALKSALGPAGTGKVWGHLVEQCQASCTRAAFPSRMINNSKNVIKMPKAVNQAMADYYSSKDFFTGGKTVRNWLNGKSFKEQFNFAKKIYKDFMEKYEKTGGKGKQWWK